MSFKKKLVTAVTTAGLLSGIFGSAFAPVAQGAVAINIGAIQAELRGNLIDDYQDLQGSPNDGSTSYPGIIYSPVYNNGLTGGGEILQAACTYIDVDDIDDLAGDELYLSDDVAASVTVTGALLVEGADDDNGISEDGDESDMATSYTDANVSDGLSLCFSVNDDDASSKSETATVKINGTTAATLYFRIVGPGQSLVLTDNTGGWVAMDNESVEDAFTIAFLDAAGNNLYTSLRNASNDEDGDLDTSAEIEDYWGSGWESDGADLEYIQDVAATGKDFNVFGSLEMSSTAGNEFRRIDLVGGAGAAFCDSARDADFGLSHQVWAVMDYDGGTTFSSSDKASNPVTVKCSAWGDEAVATKLEFEKTTVGLGEVTRLFLTIQDGYGNPMGVGTTDDIELGWADYRDCETSTWIDGDCFAIVPSPIHLDESDYYLSASGAHIDVEYYDDGDTTCSANPANENDEPINEGFDLDSEINAAGDDRYAAGVVVLCYYASSRIEDLGRNTVRAAMDYPYTYTLAVTYGVGNAPTTFTAGITLVRDTSASAGVDFGTALTKVGKRKVSVSGPVGAKITFVVENASGNTKTYNRVVGASGKATLKIKRNGTFDVYAMYGDSITNLFTITIK